MCRGWTLREAVGAGGSSPPAVTAALLGLRCAVGPDEWHSTRGKTGAGVTVRGITPLQPREGSTARRKPGQGKAGGHGGKGNNHLLSAWSLSALPRAGAAAPELLIPRPAAGSSAPELPTPCPDRSKVPLQLLPPNQDDFWDRTPGAGAGRGGQHLPVTLSPLEPADLHGRWLAPAQSPATKKFLRSCHSLPFKDFKWRTNMSGNHAPLPRSPPRVTDGARPDATAR